MVVALVCRSTAMRGNAERYMSIPNGATLASTASIVSNAGVILLPEDSCEGTDTAILRSDISCD